MEDEQLKSLAFYVLSIYSMFEKGDFNYTQYREMAALEMFLKRLNLFKMMG